MTELQKQKDFICKCIQDSDEIGSIENECEPIPDDRAGDSYKRYKPGKSIMTVSAIRYPKVEWVDCTAGEALDAGLAKVHIQRMDDTGKWEPFLYDKDKDEFIKRAMLLSFLRFGNKYRKEA